MKVLNSFAPLLLVALSATSVASAGEKLPVGNPDFADVAIECRAGFAYQTSGGATCTNRSYPAQAFNGTPGMAWVFGPHIVGVAGSGLTDPRSGFGPPSFSGLPFRRAAFLQSAGSEVSQIILGFVARQVYSLSFYLGSRTGNAGNQTVVAYIDDQSVGAWSLADSTPFTLRIVPFSVAASGPHLLRFVGAGVGDQTAFLSGVSIRAVDAADDK